MKIVKELFLYIKQPVYTGESLSPKLKHIKDLSVLFLLSYLVKIIWVLTVSKWIKENFEIARNAITNGQNSANGMLEFFLTAVIFAPLIEELIFRYFLKGKKIIIFLLAGFALSALTFWMVKQFSFTDLHLKRIVLVISLLLPLAAALYFYYGYRESSALNSIFVRYFPFSYYTSVFVFGLVHLPNFSGTSNYLLFLPLIIPQLLSGFIYGFARMKYGMWANIMLHASSNMVTFVLDAVLKI